MDLAAEGITDDLKGTPLEVGKGVIRREGKDVALIGYGNSVGECMKAAAMLEEAGLSATVMDARFCKPLDTGMIRRIAKEHPAVITVEEGSIGGFGSHVCQFLALEGAPRRAVEVPADDSAGPVHRARVAAGPTRRGGADGPAYFQDGHDACDGEKGRRRNLEISIHLVCTFMLRKLSEDLTCLARG